MYSVTVREHFMIAHSLQDDRFGPARNMHGATYVVDACFMSGKLNDMNVVVDIGVATGLLKKALASMDYRNLDEHPDFRDVLTTTEYLARNIHGKIKQGLDNNLRLKITLHESHVASASYED